MLTEAPVAQTAIYDAERGRIVVELSDGRSYAFLPRLCEELATALSEIVVDGGGLNLRWPRLDVDLFVPALLSGVFGTERWMSREFARHAGQTKSPTKAAASRANGAKGGRPKKAK